MKTKYASDNIGEIMALRGKKHDYLAMTLDFKTPGVEWKCIQSWWDINKVDRKKENIFHTFVMKSMFLCKRAKQDMLPGIVFLATRVKEPNKTIGRNLQKCLTISKQQRKTLHIWVQTTLRQSSGMLTYLLQCTKTWKATLEQLWLLETDSVYPNQPNKKSMQEVQWKVKWSQ